VKLRLILISCFLSIIPLFLLQTYQYFKQEKSALAAQEKENVRELESSAIDIGSVLSSSLDTISLLSQLSLSSISLEYNRPEALNDYLTVSNRRNNYFSKLVVFDSRKNFFTSTGGGGVLEIIKGAHAVKDVAEELERNPEADFVSYKVINGKPVFFVGAKILNTDRVLVGFLVGEISDYIIESQLQKLQGRLKSSTSLLDMPFLSDSTSVATHCSTRSLIASRALKVCFRSSQVLPRRFFNTTTLALGIALLLLAMSYFLIYSYFIGRVLRPLYNFLDNISNLMKGDFRYLSPSSKYSEINKLTDATNIIGKRLLAFQEKEIERTKSEAVAKVANQVAHDIRSPLTSLEYLVRTIGVKLAENERIIANQSLERISDILSTLNNKKNGCEKSEEKLEIIDPLVKRIIAEKRLEFKYKNNVEIIFQNFLPYGIFVNISKSDFFRAMSNLINNAAEAAAADKKLLIEIDLSFEEGMCLVKIKDNGKGIPADLVSKVLLQGVSYDKPSGSGLGLTSAKEAIEKASGTISLTSTPLVGTTVCIKLPVVSPPDWFLTKLNIKTEEVCIVDDDNSIHSVWSEIFRGLRITHLKSSEDFYSWIDSVDKSRFTFLFDLELLGFQLNGLELIREYNLEDQSILVTSHFDDKTVQKNALDIGVKIIPKDLATKIPICFSRSELEKLVLIDDDKLIHLSWRMAANKKNINLDCFFSVEEFIDRHAIYQKDTFIFIDSYLGNNVLGEVESKKIFDLGFQKIYLATGIPIENLPSWFEGQQGKSFPVTISF
jgi:signal transduction histidine kinase